MSISISSGVLVLITLIGLAMMFKKMGIEWWKAFIPVYGEYILFKEVWNTKMFGIAFVTTVLTTAINVALNVVSIKTGTFGPFLTAIGCFTSITELVFTIMVLHKVSKAFGHGTGYTVGLTFLSPIFFNILGLGKSEYQPA